MSKQWMIYGAYGYSGELTARNAVKRGLSPVLAGRSEEKLKPLAAELGLSYRAFGLDDVAALTEQLKDIGAVTHCAGPFSATAEPMMKACIQAQTHYADITGEIEVFELAHQLSGLAKAAGIVLCPGVGFDVIPTDCVAAALKEAMPDATDLTLGFDSRSGFSPGTAKTSVEGLAGGNKVRENGHIVTKPLGKLTRKIDFGDGEKTAMSIPWGDVSTAFHSTAIPNISVFIPMPPAKIKQAQKLNYVKWLLNFGFIQNMLKKNAGKVRGPNEEKRAKQITHVWGEVKNAAGDTKVARIKTANGYNVTWQGGILIPQKLMNDAPAEGGHYTPSMLMGSRFVETLEGSETIIIS